MTKRQDLLQLFISLVAIASFFMGLAGCIEYQRLGSVTGHAVFISPYLSALAIICGIALFLVRAHPRVAPWVGLVIIVALVLVRILGPEWSPGWQSGRIVSANVLTALILVGATAGLFVARSSGQQRYRPPVLETTVAMLFIASTTYVSVALIEHDITTRQDFSRSTAQSTAHSIQGGATRAQLQVKRLGERWSSFDHIPSQRYTQSELHRYLRDMPFFLSLAIVNEAGQVVTEVNQVAADSPNSLKGTIRQLLTNSDVQRQIRAASTSGSTLVTVADFGWWETPIALVVSPIFSHHMPRWSVVATVNMAHVVALAMPRTALEGHFRVTYGPHMLYETDSQSTAAALTTGHIPIPVYDDDILQLSYMYTSEGTGLKAESLAEFVWLTGLVVTFLLISSHRLTRVMHRHASQLSFNALHDPLTGLPNRRMLQHMLDKACMKARRERIRIAVVFFDVEGIRLVNDSVGHEVGDAVLVEVSKRLTCDSMPEGSIAQLGPVEFVLLLTGVDEDQVQDCTQQVINKLTAPYEISGRRISMVVSAGISMGDGYLEDPMQLVRQADLAMMKAKQLGANNWSFYSADLSERIAERIELRDDLELALENNALQLHYQPIVLGSTRKVIGIEALLRWPHPKRGFVSPSTFVPLAEDSGQIIMLTEWVLMKACIDGRTLHEQGLQPIPININISALYFQRTSFVEDMCRILEATGLAPGLLVLEITESVFLETETAAIKKMTALREMGIRFSIDDFGTGYSNLNYLKNLPVDTVKVDRSFIKDVVTSTADAAIVQGIISMAHHLGLSVIAEGVEEESQLDFLMRNRCDAFQGFLFARPMPRDALLALLKDGNYTLPAPTPEGIEQA